MQNKVVVVVAGYSISQLEIRKEEPISFIYVLRGPLYSNSYSLLVAIMVIAFARCA